MIIVTKIISINVIIAISVNTNIVTINVTIVGVDLTIIVTIVANSFIIGTTSYYDGVRVITIVCISVYPFSRRKRYLVFHCMFKL